MMAALTQSPAPAGMPPAFAALGAPGSAGGEMPAFDQLVAAAPIAAPIITADAPRVTAIVPQPVAATPLPPADAKAIAALPEAKSEIAAVPETTATPDHPAAKAATLLLAVTGRVAEPDADRVAAPAGGALLAAMPVPKPAAAPRVEEKPQVDGTPDTPQTGTAAAPAAILMPALAAAAPADKPVELARVALAEQGEAPALPATAKPREAARSAVVAIDAALPKAKPVDAGPSMTVALTQLAAPASGAIAEAATAAPVAERVLDLTSDDAWIEQLARDIAATKSQSGDISFRLMPRHLGRLDVAMRQDEGGVSLKLDTQHEATATVVHAAQGRLVEDLRQQGVRVADAEVTCTPGETGRQSQSQQGQGRGGAHDTAHLIETAPERAEARDEERAADRGGRFA